MKRRSGRDKTFTLETPCTSFSSSTKECCERVSEGMREQQAWKCQCLAVIEGHQNPPISCCERVSEGMREQQAWKCQCLAVIEGHQNPPISRFVLYESENSRP
ncbi:hypothetical protein QE152_g35320 [Popillia japonica]|uniref:Bifunctional inhibitor/plant lipid transfer protein/seed storage helical domain-containing protein n=1 Tax=Popillia japonica TaxID=7064 RepID=A0AAW1IFC5_POPJA